MVSLFVLLIVPGLTYGSIWRETSGLCRIDEFTCSNGECVKFGLTCNGVPDCADSSDEDVCSGITNTSLVQPLSREKRQTSSRCRKGQWECRSGTCISFDGKCDGVVDCPDGSDETFALCRNSTCHANWFRCAYGACVDGTAPCNDVQECADNSDELLPRCRNSTNGALGVFNCDNGQIISTADACDGVKTCSDGSDETLRACADNTCPRYQFQCAYGACADQDANCNGKEDCADGSDESDDLCRPGQVSLTTTTTTQAPIQEGNCILPPYPLHGTYTVGGNTKARPGDAYSSVLLNYSCSAGYGLDVENGQMYCQEGTWYGGDFPKCVHLCRLNQHESVTYRCLISGSRGEEGTRNCNPYEPVGTVVRVECKKPNYYSPVSLTLMRCLEGGFDTYPICAPECGRLTPNGTELIIDGVDAQRGEIPWHVGIYRTTKSSYEQICGGSLVSNTIVISAAHCFWKDVEKKLPASRFAVAVGKLYRPWDYPGDPDAQKSQVSEIRIPPKFLGSATNFQDDIAILILKTAIRYETYVRPVCLDFEYQFDKRQLQEGKLGKVAGWGLTGANGKPSMALQVAQIPFVSIETCLENSPSGFREFITSDKICAGYLNGTALCKGDSGGGLAFPETEKGIERYYLRGIVSTAPRNNDQCTQYTLTSFTHVFKHEYFIKESLYIMVSCIFLLFLVPGLACGSTVRESSGLSRNGSLGLKPSRLTRETTTSCGSGQWKCVGGTCISIERKCDGVTDCPYGSDESFALCGNHTQIQVSKCVLPPYPLHGTYTVGGEGGRRAAPGDAYPSVLLNFTCRRGYDLDSNSSTSYCQEGTWYGGFPKCVRPCRLNRHESVEHRCLISGFRGEEGTRNCNPYEPDGTMVRVKCKKPNYYSPRPLPLMRCIEGSWDTYPTCTPECGRITPKATELTADEISDGESEIPWHAPIYRRMTTQNLYQQLCGGSLVSTTHVISAAHCFWSDIDKILPASNFAVAVGKLYSSWDHPEDFNAQKSEVSEIRIPPKFLGTLTNYQDDIAVLTLKTAILYRPNVGPVCLNFDYQFDNRQLQAGKFGRIAGWRLSGTNRTRGKVDGALIQFMSIEDCLKNSPSHFREYITSDKFCTGNAYGTTLCKGDSGAGLAFPEVERGVERHYLRGVLSVAPRTDDQCAEFTIAGFTQLLKHEFFVKDAISKQTGLAESSGCREDEWRCNDGSCILSEEKCDNVQNCEDGSDESSAVCEEVTLKFGKCVLPPYPEHGTYTMKGKTDARPGQRFFTALLSYTCDDGYGITNETNQIFCFEGSWYGSSPSCVRMCRLVQHPSVEYRCRVPELDGYRSCNAQEPLGTVVHTNCRAPLYYYVGVLATMRCQQNGWDNNPVCLPECGRLTPGGMQLVVGGQGAKRGEVPWHAGIYRTINNSYSQVCGGSIVSTTLVISAAHCFWNDVRKRLPASLFTVAVGKLYRDWDHPNDTDAQKLEIRNILIPSRFRGSATNFQDDIALVILATAIRYEVFVRPVCLDFDNNLERQQLIVGKIGKVAGWGLTAVNGDFAPHLQVTNLPYVDIDQCLDQVPLAFRELVTSDKFCAGYTNGTAMCQGDSGGGLAFPAESDEGGKRYFLRGIVSTAPRNNDKCTQFTITTFTQVTKHVYFIKDYFVTDNKNQRMFTLLAVILAETVSIEPNTEQENSEMTTPASDPKKCVLPEHPTNGRYTVGGIAEDIAEDHSPGDLYNSVLLNYTCDYGFHMEESKSLLYCLDGAWFGEFPQCERYCRLNTHPSVKYDCLVGSDGDGNETRPCSLYEPLGTVIRPQCNSPKYDSWRPLPLMRCTKSGYDTYQVCNPVKSWMGTKEAETCREDQWQCRDGSCVFSGAKCDLVENCEDGSDELFDVCHENEDSSKLCILPPFPPHGTYKILGELKTRPGHAFTKAVLNYTCSDGYRLRNNINQVSCRKGVWSTKFPKCILDASCEDDDCGDSAITISSGKCVLPPYPEYGTYIMKDKPDARPGQRFLTALLSYTCANGYGFPNETNHIFCYNGTWSDSFPTCVRLCRLDQHPSVEYRCRVPELDGYRPCNLQEPLGTVVYPNCRAPHYYYSGVLSTMRCLEDGWDNYPVCLPECGRLTPGGMELVIGGRAAIRGEVPWHAGIYRLMSSNYSHICGGSIVSTTVVISAAHCFWNDIQKKLPASRFAVAVGKLYRDWDHPNDTDAQKLELKDLVIPSRFRGSATNFQDDIALVILVTAIRYEVFVRPVCLDFDHDLERRQLAIGKIGKVAGWGLTAANGDFAPLLQVTNLPYVDIDQCLDQVPLAFRELVTSDKFCAGYTNGTALCQGDSGGGLAFPESDKGVERYFIRGIVSTAPRNNDKCTQFTITTFTQVTRHEHLIKEYL
ncbi:uncharacterized protein LOC121725497 [Aricia agestis]|uniref:uncharacterized protein LOC121725497 n=1 Tax=Aricia agestis TaxID=91739 RepID=UPI001C205BF4|nr:uncharacterized protein LOC121725497 [Aricia agestis]